MELAYQFEPGRIFAKDPAGKLLAEIRFPELRRGLVNFMETFVDPSLRGRGIADELVRAAIARIKERGEKAVVTCPYAKAWFDKHPEEADVLNERARG